MNDIAYKNVRNLCRSFLLSSLGSCSVSQTRKPGKARRILPVELKNITWTRCGYVQVSAREAASVSECVYGKLYNRVVTKASNGPMQCWPSRVIADTADAATRGLPPFSFRLLGQLDDSLCRLPKQWAYTVGVP